MDINQLIRMILERGGRWKDEETSESEDEEIVEGMRMMEVDYNPSRKDEPLYKTDEQQLLAIFPEEIWEMILLDKLKNDPDAQTNSANASPYFWELLQKDRVLFLFPKVMQVMAPRNEKRKFGMCLATTDKKKDNSSSNSDSDDDDDDDYEDDPVWILDEYNVWRDTILECRLVCSAWNKGLEHCYQSTTMAGIQEMCEEDTSSLDPRSSVRRMEKSWTFEQYRIEGPWDIQLFLARFNDSHFSGIRAPPKNPLFGRWLTINVTKGQGYKNGITRVLELCGKEVWYCCMSWYVGSGTTGKEVTSEIAKCLGLMPNLRFLNMEGPENVRNISRKDFRRNPIPKLENLQMLDLDETNGWIVSEMLRVNDHVKILRMANISSGVDLKVGRLLGNLKDFSPMPSKSGDKMLEEFGHHWKLNKLYLVHASKYFGKMESCWANTLTELDFRDPFGKEKATILRESKDLRLKLPRIRRLSVWINGLFYLDFMKPMEGSLEHLEIIGEKFKKCGKKMDRERVKKEQSIELVGFEERMHKSNVWKLFGKLETVKMHLGDGPGAEFLMFSKEGEKFWCTYEH